jgi:hypothetical protein
MNIPEEEYMMRKERVVNQMPKLGNGARKPHGRVNVHFNAKRGTGRLRFTAVHPDQLDTILLALKNARTEMQTEYDTAALDMICLNYLSMCPAAKMDHASRTATKKLQSIAKSEDQDL